MFEFKNVLTDNTEHTYDLEDNEGSYQLTMTVTKDYINNFKFIIRSKIENYKYYITADKLTRVQK